VTLDPLNHLEPREITPFEAIEAVDSALAITRLAMASQLGVLLAEAKQDDGEQYLTEALGFLWSARESLVACVEVDDE
jgi:hypothetical protein